MQVEEGRANKALLKASVAAFALAALVAWWALAARDTPSGARTTVRVDVEPSAAVLLTADEGGERPADGARLRAVDIAGERTVSVVVLDAETGGPVPAAQVAVSLARGDQALVLFVTEARIVARGTTDSLGRAVLRIGNVLEGQPMAWTLSAAKSGYAPTHAELPAEASDAELVLEAGKIISGTVVDLQGVPVAGVQVLARYDGAPVAAAEWAGASFEARLVRAETGPDGRFLLEGLHDGAYWLRAYGDGWRSEELFKPGRFRHRGERVNAGFEHHFHVVSPYRCVRFQLVYGDGTPFCADSLQFGILVRGTESGVVATQCFLEPRRALIGGKWTSVQGPASEPGVFVGFVPLTSAVAPQRVRALIEARGADAPTVTMLTLRRPSDLLSGREVDRVRVGGIPSASGRLVASCSYYKAPLVRGGPPRLRLVDEDGVRKYVRGRAIGVDKWSFDSVPVGPWRAAIVDMNAATRTLDIVVQRDEVHELDFVFQSPSGITLNLVDVKGARIFNPDLVRLMAESGRTVYPMPSFDPAPASFGQDGKTLQSQLIQLRPGRYILEVGRVGYATTTVPDVVIPSEPGVQVIRVTMAPARSGGG